MAEIKNRKDFENVIRQLNDRLSQKYNDFAGITFFGSRCKGNFTADSDFDILVQFNRTLHWQEENDVLDIIYEAELENDIVIDAKVYNNEEIKKQNTPFRVNVLKEGIFYAA